MVICDCWELMGNCLPLIGSRGRNEDSHNLNSNVQPVALDQPNYGHRSNRVFAPDNDTVTQQNSNVFDRQQRRILPSSACNVDNTAEHLRISHRRALIARLKTGVYKEGCKADRECIICMDEFDEGDELRYLPCLHSYHAQCIDNWLTRKFQCPSCMEPVELGLFSAFSNAHEAPINMLSSLPSTSWPRTIKSTESASPSKPDLKTTQEATALPDKSPIE